MEVKDLNKILKTNLELPSHRRNNFDNLAEIVDKDDTLKIICRRCGGEGAYIMQWADPKTLKIVKKEVLKCDECEDGFRYGIEQRPSLGGRLGSTGISGNQRR